MTCHVAFSGADGGVMFSDSQGSTQTSEAHGLQKQLCGHDFLIGASGGMMIIDALLERLAEPTVRASDVEIEVRRFLEQEVQPAARGSISLLLVTESGIKEFWPTVFVNFNRTKSGASIGSGAEFVNRATSRDTSRGIAPTYTSLAERVVGVYDLIRAANESLTVDDNFLVGFVVKDRAYQMGHQDVLPRYGRPELVKHWRAASRQFEEIIAIVEAIDGEIWQAQRSLSRITSGALVDSDIVRIQNANGSVAALLDALSQALQKYFVWYDGLLKRP